MTSYPVLAWVAFIILVVFGVLLYYRTNPPLPLYLRIIFGALRVVAILALFSALLEPVVNYSRKFQQEKKVSVLLDQSASMDKIENKQSRAERLDSLLASTSFANLQSQVEISSFYFGGNLSETKVMVDRDKTAIGDIISELEKKELTAPSDYWFLFSEGNSNFGQNPKDAARGLTTPIVTINMAGKTELFDVGLGELEFNPVVFVGKQTELAVKINWQNAGEERLKIKLTDADRVLDEKVFVIDQEDGQGEVVFKYYPTEPGQKLYRVSVTPHENEETTDNNERTFAVKVLKSRLLVLLASEMPDYEVGFLKRYLSQSDRYEVELVVTGKKSGNLKGHFPDRQTDLNRFDLVILHDPNVSLLESRIDIIRNYLGERGGAVWLMMGEQFASGGPVTTYDDLLPFYPSVKRKVTYLDFHATPSEGNLFHPVVRLAEDQSSIRQAWIELPPFKALVKCDRLNPQAVVLAQVALGPSADQKFPILGYRQIGPGKILASSAMPFWHWGFVGLGYDAGVENYKKFIEGTVSWLTVEEDFDPLQVFPVKEIFTRGEEVRFNGHAFDLGFRPINGVSGIVRLKKEENGESFERDLIAVGEGRLTTQFTGLNPGSYIYDAVLEKDGQVLKKTQGKILVAAYSLEELDQSAKPDMLIAVSRLSGGKYYHFRQFDKALEDFDTSRKTVVKKSEIVIWNKPWLLLIFIVALSIEWLMRKVYQMI